MSTFHVDSEAVMAATSSVHATIDRIRSEASSLHSQLTALQDSWSGQASSAFQGVIGDWRATQQRVEESLGNINAALTRAGQQYADIEAANTRLFA